MRRAVFIVVGSCLALVVGGAVLLFAYKPRPSGPPPLYPDAVPHFVFTDENDQVFRSEQELAGKVWVANFVFTRCPTICPLFTKKMAEVQKEALPLRASMRLVSFTVDPAFDTPAVLKAYAEKHKAEPGFWHFLTGSHDALKKTIVTDLKIHMSDESEDIMAIAHGGHFVLVDQQMRLRGYYNSEDEDAVARLVADMKKVVEEE